MSNAASSYRLQIVTMAVGPYVIAMARVGGITIKGQMMSDPGSALRALFRELAAPATNQDALLAVELIAAGDDFEDLQLQVDDVLALSGRQQDRELVRGALPQARRLGELPEARAHDQQDGQGQPRQHE